MASTHRAIEGFARDDVTVADILRMQDAGLISEDDNFELVEGKIVPMGPKFSAHERVKSAVGMTLARAVGDDLIVGFETSILFSDTTFLEPDLSVFPKRLPSRDVRGPDILLAIEVAASSLTYDRGVKARLYARFGVREYWVIDANTRRTWIHAGPTEAGWTSVREIASDAELGCAAIPGFAMRLSAI